MQGVHSPLSRIFIMLALLLSSLAVQPNNGCPVWINEFHYDNKAADNSEFIEIATSGADGDTALTAWTVQLYDGRGGNIYKTLPVPEVVIGATRVGYSVVTMDPNTLRNQPPWGSPSSTPAAMSSSSSRMRGPSRRRTARRRA